MVSDHRLPPVKRPVVLEEAEGVVPVGLTGHTPSMKLLKT